jgi:hypothetical protein
VRCFVGPVGFGEEAGSDLDGCHAHGLEWKDCIPGVVEIGVLVGLRSEGDAEC